MSVRTAERHSEATTRRYRPNYRYTLGQRCIARRKVLSLLRATGASSRSSRQEEFDDTRIASQKKELDQLWERLGELGLHDLFAYHEVNADNIIGMDKFSLKEMFEGDRALQRLPEVATVRLKDTQKQLVVLRVPTRSSTAVLATMESLLDNSARNLQDVCHERILRYFGHEETGHHRHIYFESISATPLSDLATEYGNHLPKEVITSIMYQLLEGVQHIHGDMRLVHNAITTDTVLLNNTGCVKITGFGLSQPALGSDDPLGPTLCEYLDAAQDTFWYAPEITGRKCCGYKSDIWSIGCLATELCSGKRPRPRSMWPSTDSASEQARSVLRLLESADMSKTGFTDLISNMIHEHPEQRYHTVQLLEWFQKKSATLNITYERIKELTTSPSAMVEMSPFYASSCLGPPLHDQMVSDPSAVRGRGKTSRMEFGT